MTAYELHISDWGSDVCSSDLSVSIAFFGGADEAGAAIAQFARFAAIAAVAAALLCYVLLPLAGDYGSFVVILGLFMMPIAAWSVSNPPPPPTNGRAPRRAEARRVGKECVS